MVEAIGPLPSRWAAKWGMIKQTGPDEERFSLEEWLEEVYFDEGKAAQLTRKQVSCWAKIIRMLMRFEPAERISAARLLDNQWWNI